MAREKIKDKFFEEMNKELDSLIDKKTGFVNKKFVEEIKCPLCVKNSYDTLFVKNGMNFVRCKKCNFVYINPRLKEDKILEGYSESKEIKSNRIWKDVLMSGKQKKFNDEAYNLIINEIKKIKPSGSLLDVGCSIGHFMEIAKEEGYDVSGIEVEPTARKVAQDKGFLVYDKKVEDLSFEKNQFDIITLLGLIEHLPNPVEFMLNVNRLLEKDGVIVINGLPNVSSLVVMSLKDKARVFNGRNHLGYYNKETLEFLLKKTGFELKYFNTYVSGLDSIINHSQFVDPFGDIVTNHLPVLLKEKVENNRKEIEENIIGFGLGYKIRAVAVKIKDI